MDLYVSYRALDEDILTAVAAKLADEIKMLMRDVSQLFPSVFRRDDREQVPNPKP
jgi:hypothetical protein